MIHRYRYLLECDNLATWSPKTHHVQEYLAHSLSQE